jgi:surface antigen
MGRLCAPSRLAVLAALFGALACGGCSFQLESMLSKPDSQADISGSIGRAAAKSDHAAKVSEADLAYAKAAAAAALEQGSRGNSVPWRNPQTGVGGNITPLAASYSEGGHSCRNFLASYVNGGAQSWLQGSACRTARGEWQVKNLKPMSSG